MKPIMIIAIIFGIWNSVVAETYTALRAPGYAESMGWKQGDSIVIVPATEQTIPAYGFAGLEDIVEVRFEGGSRLRTIGEHAFLGCKSLREITLPTTVSKLGEGSFRECLKLEEITIPEKVRVIPGMCFRGCEALRRVTLPKGLEDIKQFAFIYCERLGTVELPESLIHIGNNAFSYCTSLSQIRIPDRVKEIESYAFSDCHRLKEARLPANGDMLGELLFSDCRELEKLEEPSEEVPTFDCNSFIFDPMDRAAYERCVLLVPADKERKYRESAGWGMFENINTSTP